MNPGNARCWPCQKGQKRTFLCHGCKKPMPSGKFCADCWAAKRTSERARAKEQRDLIAAQLKETRVARRSWSWCQAPKCPLKAESEHARWCSAHRPGQQEPRATDYLRTSAWMEGL
jgi:hypothetical protein